MRCVMRIAVARKNRERKLVRKKKKRLTPNEIFFEFLGKVYHE